MQENYIPKEIPVWVVDGVNRIFTVTYNIDKLDEFFVGNSPYYWIESVAGKTITLDVAPPTPDADWTLYVDYYKIWA